MKDLNKILLIGRLGNDPVRRETKSGLAVTHFSLATSYKGKESSEAGTEGEASGSKEGGAEETTWHNIVVWGRQADVCHQFLRKGRTVYVEGSIRKRTFTGKDGQQRHTYEVNADAVGFLGSGRNQSTQGDEVGESMSAAS